MKPVEPTSTVGLGYFSRIHSKTTATKNPAKASVTPQLSGHLMAMAMPAKDVAKAINWQNRHHLCVWGLPAAPWSRRRSFATVGSKCPAVLRRIRNADLSCCDLARGVGKICPNPILPEAAMRINPFSILVAEPSLLRVLRVRQRSTGKSTLSSPRFASTSAFPDFCDTEPLVHEGSGEAPETDGPAPGFRPLS